LAVVGRGGAADYSLHARRQRHAVCDAASEAFLSEIVGAAPWPGQRHWNMESIYEYGARAGFWRLHRLFTEFGAPVTVYGVATALERSPAQVDAMQAAGWEIASHGLKWIDYKDYDPEDERADMLAAIRIHREVTGERPLGWYTGRCSVNTVDLATEEGGFEYVSDAYSDDLPYWRWSDGVAQLIIPYTLDANDMRFATPPTCGLRRRRGSIRGNSSSPISRTALTRSMPKARRGRRK
jgi:chitin deacetylase